MKWMIASDLHGSAYYCRKMLEAFEREGADRLFLLGDLLYHGPRNDLPRLDIKIIDAIGINLTLDFMYKHHHSFIKYIPKS